MTNPDISNSRRRAYFWTRWMATFKVGRDVEPASTASGRDHSRTSGHSPMSIGAQWLRLAGIVSKAIERAQQANECHRAATRQIDLAQYALSSLVDELSAVMTIRGHRPMAVVHVFEPSAQRPARQALAA
jgi:hypothetical protein